MTKVGTRLQLMGWSGRAPARQRLAGISRGVSIIIVSTAATHTPLPTWSNFEMKWIFPLSP